MAIWQGESVRKRSGGRRIYARKKRKFEIGSERCETVIGEQRKKKLYGRGNTEKIRILAETTANVLDPRSKKMQVSKILAVVENPANPHYVRRNIITKGAIIDTELGRAKVTSRPGQHGVINAVLIK
jgi:small subunit ribosomal protein S8e